MYFTIRSYNCLIEDNLFDRPGDRSDPRMPNRAAPFGLGIVKIRLYNEIIVYT